MPYKHDLTSSRIKIPSNAGSNNVIQNISDYPLQWTEDESSDAYYSIRPGDFLKVNYDIWVKSESLDTRHVVNGVFPDTQSSVVTVYRENVVLNKTYVQNKSANTEVSTTLRVLNEFPAITIQKDKNIKISVRFPFINRAVAGSVNIQLGIKVNNVDHILSDSDTVLCGSASARESQSYVRSFVLDPIFLGLVVAGAAGAAYTIRVKLSGKTSSSTGTTSTKINASDVPAFGTLLPSARNQNYISVIVEELDR